ncbi:hypothetical protein [Nocardia salmonicida]|uniref:hypothetical protein n=1 Tax=Nocardia salmonicida TaxID=53431 RepID=UPI00341CD6CB
MSNHNDVVSHQDYGFFGPDSVAWRVFRYPTTLSVAFQRTAVTEMFEPFLMASVADTGAVLNRPDIDARLLRTHEAGSGRAGRDPGACGPSPRRGQA